MKIYPVVSNVIRIELENGALFELYEGCETGLDIKALNGSLVARELNTATVSLDEVWRGQSINLTEEK